MKRTCGVCGEPADGYCRVDTGVGPIRGFLCERDAEDMANYLDQWEPFVAERP